MSTAPKKTPTVVGDQNGDVLDGNKNVRFVMSPDKWIGTLECLNKQVFYFGLLPRDDIKEILTKGVN
uniref:Transposase n=1 Tax=Rhabditophanes sp. KR3021 TaxID=114890 RepID=A0AC35TT43_9BILA